MDVSFHFNLYSQKSIKECFIQTLIDCIFPALYLRVLGCEWQIPTELELRPFILAYLLRVVQRIMLAVYLLILHCLCDSLYIEMKRIRSGLDSPRPTFDYDLLQLNRHWDDCEVHLVNRKLCSCVFILVHLLSPSYLLSSLPGCSLEHTGLDCDEQEKAAAVIKCWIWGRMV